MNRNGVAKLSSEEKKHVDYRNGINTESQAFKNMHLTELKAMIKNMDASELMAIAEMIPYDILLDRLKREMDACSSGLRTIKEVLKMRENDLNGGQVHGDD